jgi:hypothetical protein
MNNDYPIFFSRTVIDSLTVSGAAEVINGVTYVNGYRVVAIDNLPVDQEKHVSGRIMNRHERRKSERLE